MSQIRLAVGLLHWPVLDRTKRVVATNITNLDVHDIARACRVYGVESYYLVHPAQEQLMFVARLLDHWRVGEGQRFNPMRATALTMVQTAPSLERAVAEFDPEAVVIGTTARTIEGLSRVSFAELRSFLHGELQPSPGESKIASDIRAKLTGRKSIFLLFGTGFGMTEEVLRACDLLLEPMRGAPPLDYRHLSVRSAVSICLDRLLGTW